MSEGIEEFADTIRKKVYELKIPHEFSEEEFVSVSIGISTMNITKREDVNRVIELADRALYIAKKFREKLYKKHKRMIIYVLKPLSNKS